MSQREVVKVHGEPCDNREPPILARIPVLRKLEAIPLNLEKSDRELFGVLEMFVNVNKFSVITSVTTLFQPSQSKVLY